MNRYLLRYSLAACLVAILSVLCVHTDAQPSAAAMQAINTFADTEIPTAQLLQPEELMQLLRSSREEKPLILQVGSHVLYAEAHIPLSEYTGAGGQESGLQALRDRVMGLKRDRFHRHLLRVLPMEQVPQHSARVPGIANSWLHSRSRCSISPITWEPIG